MGRLTREEISQARARLANEELISAREAAALLNVPLPTVVNYMIRGIQGIHLDALRDGNGDWTTSAEAVGRFILARAGAAGTG